MLYKKEDETNMKGIKILHIFSGVGGGISAWIRKAVACSDCEDKIVNDAMAFSITNKSNFIDIVEKKGGKCMEMPRMRSGVISLIRFIGRAINQEGYDMVHCHIDGVQALPVWIAVRWIAHKPLIIHSHRTAIEKIAGKRYEKLVYVINRMVNKVIAGHKAACGEKAKEFDYNNEALKRGMNRIIDEILQEEK